MSANAITSDNNSWTQQLFDLVYGVHREGLLTVPVAFTIASRAIGFKVGAAGACRDISEHHYARAKKALDGIAASARRLKSSFVAVPKGKKSPTQRQWIEQQLGLR